MTGATSVRLRGERDARARGRADIGARALVVGAAGFLGHAMVRGLLARGVEVHAFDRAPCFEGVPGVTPFVGDIRDADAVRRATEGCASVFHTAAVINLLGICREAVRREVFGINLDGTRNVIEACRAAGTERLLYTSTNSVCFRHHPVVDGDETMPYATSFVDVYAESKVAAERAVLAADVPGSLRTAAFRPAGLWGPGALSFMIMKFVDELSKGKLVATLGDGTAVSDNTHVENLVHAELLAAERLATDPDPVGGQAFFVTDEEQMNLMTWFRPLIEGLGYPFPTRTVPRAVVYASAWLMEALHYLGGPRPVMTRIEVHKLTTSFTFRTDKARRLLGYAPLVQRDEGLAEILPFCRDVVAEKRRAAGR